MKSELGDEVRLRHMKYDAFLLGSGKRWSFFVMEGIEEVIQFRLQRSDEALEEALLLANEGYFNTVVSRLYYSAFYAVSALLLKSKIYSKSHSGLKALFMNI